MAVFLAADDYDGPSADSNPKTISATGLMKPVRQIVLGKRLNKDIGMMDISSLISSRMGQAYHAAVEHAWLYKLEQALERLGMPKKVRNLIVINPTPEQLTEDCIPVYIEQRTEREVMGWVISGKFDLILDGVLEDVKSTSVFTYVKQLNKDKYALQGSIYRWLNSTLITEPHLIINYIFTDWSSARARTEKAYPPLKIFPQKIPLLDLAQTDSYIKGKLRQIDQYMNVEESKLPFCGDEDLWRKETVWKYYSSIDSVRSSKNFDSNYEAQNHLMAKGKGLVREVKGEVLACQYCDAYNLCTQKDIYLASGELKV